MNRAYSLLSVEKAVEEGGKRLVRGVATTPAVDRVGDTIDPMGVKFTNPMAFLWQHRHDQPIGWVTFGTPTKDGIPFEAEVAIVDEDGELKVFLDKCWQQLKHKLVRAVSIGFRATKWAWIGDYDGIEYQEIECFELSAVTIPANPEAVITEISGAKGADLALVLKKFDTGAPAASGRPEPPAKPARVRAKSSHSISLTPKEGDKMKTLAEQIAALEAKRAANAARMAEVMQKSIDEGRSTDASEQEEFDNLEAEIEAIDGDLKRLKALEKAQAATAKPVGQVRTIEDGSVARGGGTIVQVKTQKLAPGIGFARLARVKALAKLNNESARTMAKELYGEDSEVFQVIAKAAVPAATTSHATWAGPLVGDETSIFADFVEFLRPQTILGRFGAGGVPSLRRVPFRVPLIGQTSGGAGYWVGEGAPKPLTKFDFSRTTLEPTKVANIAVATMETLRDSSPSAEMIIRDQLAAALVARLDTDFIDPTKAASAGVSPASITNGLTFVASAGNTADDVRADIKALFGAFIAANNAPTSGVWIMPATTALALSLMTNPMGQPEFPGISMNGGTLFGLPVIVSQYVPTAYDPDDAGTEYVEGALVVLANASDIYLADEGGVAVDMSQEASLQMDDAPTNNSATPTATSMVSMFQTNSVAFRAERTVNWAKRRASAVAALAGVNWGG